ncbi:MAG: arylsulfatase B [Mariniblastus sp.]|jgi:arylsulfatase B
MPAPFTASSMNRFQFFIGLILIVGILQPAMADDPPNIIHVIVDDLGWNDVGFHGSQIKTPAIDRLASESIVLDRFYVAPICSPTRAGTLTGRYPFRFGIWGGVVSPTKRHGLPPSEFTTPELLAKAGYRNRAIFGKWHLGLASTLFHPLNHGFTEFYGHYNGAIDYFSRERSGELDWHRDFDAVHEKGYSTDLLGQAAVEFINRQSTQTPFYLLVTFNAPHSPLQAKPEDLDAYGFDPTQARTPNTDRKIAKRENAPKYGEGGKGNTTRQTFSAMTTALDRNIQKILDAVDQSGIRDNTLIILHSDNGADPRHGGSNSPLRGNKFSTWEGGVRVVAMIRWPAKWKGGTQCSALTSYLDLLPTQLAAAGQTIPNNIDGINLMPLLSMPDSSSKRTILLGKNSIVSTRWKLVKQQLFDLQADPNEANDVAAEHPDVVKSLTQSLAEFPKLLGPQTLSALPQSQTWPPKEWSIPIEPKSK